MSKTIHITTIVLATLIMTGCVPEQTQNRVGVIDLERVANEAGFIRQINAQLEQLRVNLQSQLTNVEGELTAQLSEKQESFGEKPSEEQQKELSLMFAGAKQQLQTVQQEAVSTLRQGRESLVNQLYETVRPFAKQIADEKSINVVLRKHELLVFDYDPELDITDEVIDAIIAARASATAPTLQTEPAPQ